MSIAASAGERAAEHAGHMVAGEDNDVLTSAVRTFLAGLDGTP